MQVVTKNASDVTVYTRDIESDQEHTAKVLSFLMGVPQGTAYSTTLTTGAFSHTFRHSEELNLRNLVAKVEGLVVRERKATEATAS